MWIGAIARIITVLHCAGTFAGMSTEQLDSFLKTLREKQPELEMRVVQISARFIGTPYLLSPLGEGPGHGPNPNPLIRLNRVDCTTFIEQTLAMAMSCNTLETLENLRYIRYEHGQVGYVTRKHFMMAQWIPANQEEGFIEDITAEVGGDRTRWIRKRLDASVWQRRWNRPKWPSLKPSQVPSGSFALPIIPLENMEAVLQEIPSGTILSVVREERPWIPERITHQGFVVARQGRVFLRHASKAPFHRVVDEPMERFLKRNIAYRKWSVEGFNLQKPRRDRAREKTGC